MKTQEDLEELLNSFESDARRKALEKLAAKFLPAHPVTHANVNLHFHSFFSYNAEGWSPSRIAWESKKAGLYAAALCDFDVLDGLDEFLDAGHQLRLRSAVHLETRAFFNEYAHADISSPGEPGVTYIMGAGFTRPPQPGTLQAKSLEGYRERARARNLALISRINERLPDVAIRYEEDVLPLTPAGVATERHIVSGYVLKSKSVYPRPSMTAQYWGGVLNRPADDTLVLMADTAAFEEVLRSRLAKRGGLGYEQPSVSTFPPVDEFIAWVLSCDAVPMITWLDGTSAGEKNGRAMLECMQAKGAAALNIIPDRNWNVSNEQTRSTKMANLRAVIDAARALHLPVNIGTEMNRQGLPFVDDLDCLALSSYKDLFLRGARVMVGHTLLHRYAGMSYVGDRARAEFPDLVARNAFFEKVGGLPPLGRKEAEGLLARGQEAAATWFRDAVRG